MGFRVRWSVSIERSDPPPREVGRSPALIRWATVGLAVVGIIAVAVWRLYGGG